MCFCKEHIVRIWDHVQRHVLIGSISEHCFRSIIIILSIINYYSEGIILFVPLIFFVSFEVHLVCRYVS